MAAQVSEMAYQSPVGRGGELTPELNPVGCWLHKLYYALTSCIKMQLQWNYQGNNSRIERPRLAFGGAFAS
jgi:hypothetical protein